MQFCELLAKQNQNMYNSSPPKLNILPMDYLSSHYKPNLASQRPTASSRKEWPQRKLKWNDLAQNTFNKVFTAAPILQHPNPEKPFIVEVDASDLRVEAILSQFLFYGKNSPPHNKTMMWGIERISGYETCSR